MYNFYKSISCYQHHSLSILYISCAPRSGTLPHSHMLPISLISCYFCCQCMHLHKHDKIHLTAFPAFLSSLIQPISAFPLFLADKGYLLVKMSFSFLFVERFHFLLTPFCWDLYLLPDLTFCRIWVSLFVLLLCRLLGVFELIYYLLLVFICLRFDA